MEPEEDHALDNWAGVIPLELRAGPPRNCTDLKVGIAVSGYAIDYKRKR
jgi:hypothetical protein